MALRDSDPLALEEPAEDGQVMREEDLDLHGSCSQVPCKVLRGHGYAVTSCHLCFDDTRLLTSSHDNTAIPWDTDRSVALQCYGGSHSAGIIECSLVPGTNRMVTVSWDKTMVCWDLETAKTLWTSRHAGLLTSCSVTSDGKLIGCVSDMDNVMYISMATNGEFLHKIREHHRSTMTCCRFEPQGQHVATVSVDRSITLWDLLALRTTMSISSNHSNTVSSCCFTDNGARRHGTGASSCGTWWPGPSAPGGPSGLGGAHAGSVSSCAFSADAQVLVSGSYDRNVALWDMTSQAHMLRLRCGQCGGSFCVSSPGTTSEHRTDCVFCRMKTTGRSRPQPPAL